MQSNWKSIQIGHFSLYAFHYYISDQATVKLLDDDQSRHYSKLQHHHRGDDSPSSSNQYNMLQPQQPQSYAQEGPKESDSNVTYEEIPYHEITSKSDENQ